MGRGTSCSTTTVSRGFSSRTRAPRRSDDSERIMLTRTRCMYYSCWVVFSNSVRLAGVWEPAMKWASQFQFQFDKYVLKIRLSFNLSTRPFGFTRPWPAISSKAFYIVLRSPPQDEHEHMTNNPTHIFARRLTTAPRRSVTTSRMRCSPRWGMRCFRPLEETYPCRACSGLRLQSHQSNRVYQHRQLFRLPPHRLQLPYLPRRLCFPLVSQQRRRLSRIVCFSNAHLKFASNTIHMTIGCARCALPTGWIPLKFEMYQVHIATANS
jgi:hypothetical protein